MKINIIYLIALPSVYVIKRQSFRGACVVFMLALSSRRGRRVVQELAVDVANRHYAVSLL